MIYVNCELTIDNDCRNSQFTIANSQPQPRELSICLALFSFKKIYQCYQCHSVDQCYGYYGWLCGTYYHP